MSVAMAYLQDLTDADIYFIVRTIVDRRQDYDHICDLLKDKPDLVEIMLEDEKLFQRIRGDQDILVEISPFLLFSILIQHTKKHLEEESYMTTVDMDALFPVFHAKDAVKMLDSKDIRAYLARMLASFTRVDNSKITYHTPELKSYQPNFTDLDFDDVLELAELVEFPYRYDFYKRLGDISLFITGIFPEYMTADIYNRYLDASRYRTVEDYEEEGRRYYNLAAAYDEAKEQNLSHILSSFAEKFTIIRKPLIYLSENLISEYREKLFS